MTTDSKGDWDRKLLELRIQHLEREYKHLSKKSLERDLNSWEKNRLSRLGKDMLRLVHRLAAREQQMKSAA